MQMLKDLPAIRENVLVFCLCMNLENIVHYYLISLERGKYRKFALEKRNTCDLD